MCRSRPATGACAGGVGAGAVGGDQRCADRDLQLRWSAPLSLQTRVEINDVQIETCNLKCHRYLVRTGPVEIDVVRHENRNLSSGGAA